MIVLDGKAVAQKRRDLLTPKVEKFRSTYGRAPHLVVVLIGEDPASQVYVRNKMKACEKVGIQSTRKAYPSGMDQKGLGRLIEELNQDEGVDGVLVQLPLPQGLDDSIVNQKLEALKDSDGLTYFSMGHLFAGKPLVAPCTPSGIMILLKEYQISVAGMRAVVVGRSQIVGRPMAQLLTMQDATVTVCHSRTKDLRAHTQAADLVVVAAGKKRFLGKDDFKKDAVVIDVGMHGTGSGGELCGDVRFEELQGWAKAATPVPGGVGPLTISTLLENTLHLAELRQQLRRNK